MIKKTRNKTNMQFTSARTQAITNRILEGEQPDSLLTQVANSPVIGKKLTGVPCPHCGSENYMWIQQEKNSYKDGANMVYVVEVRCDNCSKTSQIELTLDQK